MFSAQEIDIEVGATSALVPALTVSVMVTPISDPFVANCSVPLTPVQPAVATMLYVRPVDALLDVRFGVAGGVTVNPESGVKLTTMVPDGVDAGLITNVAAVPDRRLCCTRLRPRHLRCLRSV